jgi:hypothetical protein
MGRSFRLREIFALAAGHGVGWIRGVFGYVSRCSAEAVSDGGNTSSALGLWL